MSKVMNSRKGVSKRTAARCARLLFECTETLGAASLSVRGSPDYPAYFDAEVRMHKPLLRMLARLFTKFPDLEPRDEEEEARYYRRIEREANGETSAE